MKLALPVLLATALGVPLVHANAKDSQLRHQSLAALDAHSEVKATEKKVVPMPTVKHQKEAGDGYSKNSPLYNRQQRYLTSSSTTAAPDSGSSSYFGGYSTYFGGTEDKSTAGASGGTNWWNNWTIFFSYLAYSVFQVLFIFACGWFYHNKQHEPWMKTQQRRELNQRREDYERNNEKGTLSFPAVFGGGEALPWDYCLMTICCWPLRWAETMTSDPRSDKRPFDFLKTFFAALGFVIVLIVLNLWTQGLAGLVLWGAVVYGRTRLRRIHGIDPSTKNLLIDACCWYGPCNPFGSCCALYATVEEAKLVDRTAEVKL